MENKSLFIIKPDGISRRDEIKADISQSFRITDTYLFNFDLDMVKGIYTNDVGKPHYAALEEYMLEDFCELGIIEGESAVERFYALTGKFSHPLDCGDNTLRYKYGKGQDRTKSGLFIVKNAIHRPKSQEELMFDLNLFKSKDIL